MGLAAALVYESKILTLEESTSSAEYGADAKIQSAIVDEFCHTAPSFECRINCIQTQDYRS
jgi:ABC-type multidrug transport system fused ATPase/permease subunit